ncbi:Histidine kinase A [Pelomyxa schiedti]|nr:Histidine kinase A [Pelomyxa schiedti]
MTRPLSRPQVGAIKFPERFVFDVPSVPNATAASASGDAQQAVANAPNAVANIPTTAANTGVIPRSGSDPVLALPESPRDESPGARWKPGMNLAEAFLKVTVMNIRIHKTVLGDKKINEIVGGCSIRLGDIINCDDLFNWIFVMREARPGMGKSIAGRILLRVSMYDPSILARREATLKKILETEIDLKPRHSSPPPRFTPHPLARVSLRTSQVSSPPLRPLAYTNSSSSEVTNIETGTYSTPPPSPAPPAPPPPQQGAYESYSSAPLSGKESLPEISKTPKCDSPDFSEEALFSYDFNERFQILTERLHSLTALSSSFKDKITINSALIDLASDFVNSARTYGRIIIKERFVPETRKTIHAVNVGGFAGGEKYIVHNILFKFAVNSRNLFRSDSDAAKVAGHELKSLISIYNQELVGISLPLMALVDFRGYRLIALSLLPIGDNTLVMGSADAMATIHQPPPEIQEIMTRLSTKLNLRTHLMQSVPVFTCVDTEGHIASDGRFYLVDFSRTFPPEAPPRKDLKVPHLFQLLRPECVLQCRKPLCSDAYSKFLANQEAEREMNEDVLSASQNLQSNTIPECAENLVDILCGEMSGNDLLDFSLTTFVHSWGVNIRHLGKMFDSITQQTSMYPHTINACKDAKALVCIEMIARSLRHVLDVEQRALMEKFKLPYEAPFTQLYLESFRRFSKCSPGYSDFWEKIFLDLKNVYDWDIYQNTAVSNPESNTEDVLKQCTEFSEDTGFSTSTGYLMLVIRALKLSGCKLKQRLMKQLYSNPALTFTTMEKLFEGDIKEIKERVKHMNIINHARGYLMKMQANNTSDPKQYFFHSRKNFLKALSSSPNNKVSLRNLAQISLRSQPACVHEQLSQVESAYNYYRHAMQTDPDDIETLYQYGEFLLCEMEEAAASEQILLTLVEKDCHAGRVLEALRLVYQKLCLTKEEGIISAFYRKLVSIHKTKL